MVPVWKRILKWIAWCFGGALALVIVAYLTLLAINWRDQPPSAAAERLTAAYRDRTPIADADNGFVYAMGFIVAPDEDPQQAGIRRIEWLRSLPVDPTASARPDPVPAYDSYQSARSPAVEKILSACWRITPECAGALEGSEHTLRAWLASEQWLLDRYRTLLRHPGWLEVMPSNPRAPFDATDSLLEGQRLLMARAYLLAGENDAAAVMELLGDDARFWRGVLASSDLLATKMVATIALTQSFTIGNLVLRRLPAEAQLSALPVGWTRPFTIAERSLFRCMAGEWTYSRQLIKHDPASPKSFGYFDWDHDLRSKLLAHVTAFLFKPQDFSNRHAKLLLQITEAVDVPIEQVPAGLERVRAILQEPNADRSFLAVLYNPVGSYLLRTMSSVYNPFPYPVRVTDLEGVRRAAVLTAQLRAQRINEQSIPAELEGSDIRTPYSGAPFIWNAKERAVQFIGLVPGERGRHSFKY